MSQLFFNWAPMMMMIMETHCESETYFELEFIFTTSVLCVAQRDLFSSIVEWLCDNWLWKNVDKVHTFWEDHKKWVLTVSQN